MSLRYTGRAAVLVLAVIACALATPSSAKPKKPKGGEAATAVADTSAVLVRVGRETITRSDVQRRIEDLPEAMRAGASTPEGRQQLIDRMVEEKVWLMAATQAGVA